MSEKIKPHHLARKALLYVRQSSQRQVLHNQESQRLQYRMEERLKSLGWRNIEVIDEDLGKSAGGGMERPGFTRMIAEVCLGEVGVVAAREVSRFARNSREWQQLVEVCRVVDTLLLDEETAYDARQGNDRLLLGLKGSLNEYELELFRQRSQEARREKAKRGELAVTPPVGYIHVGEGCLEKDPDQRVQQAIGVVFAKFLELGSARQVLLWLQDNALETPASRWEDGEWRTTWRRPRYHAVLRFLKHPAYAGAYAWGRRKTQTIVKDGVVRQVRHHRSHGEWLVLVPGHHEGYIPWETYERIQEMIRKNRQASRQTTGAAKRGQALLAGLLRCSRCGGKLQVRYSGSAKALRYVCRNGTDLGQIHGCISFSGEPVDDAVEREVMRVVQPGALEAAELAAGEAAKRQDQARQALELELEARRYAADRARRQYDASDPENRLVAAELERRWNVALEAVEELRCRLDEENARQEAEAPPRKETFLTLAKNLSAVWDNPGTDVRLKKRIVRTLIEEVVTDVDSQAYEVHVLVHWKGGVHTKIRIPQRRPGQTRHAASKDVVEAVRVLSLVCSDARIAGWLTQNGLRTGKGKRWTRQHVTGLRHSNAIPVYDPQRQEAEGWLTQSQAAAYLGIDRVTLRLAVDRGDLPAIRPLPVGPWVLKREDLDSPVAQRFAQRVRQHREAHRRDNQDQLTSDLFTT